LVRLARSRRRTGYIASPLRDGVDQPFLAQHRDCPPGSGPRDLERLHQLTFGRDARVGLVLAGLDPPPQDARDLPVRRERGNRVNPVISHIDKSNCLKLTSYVDRRVDTS
jgi:hypothetical protein